MSKVAELREKYSKQISQSIFESFLDSDQTETKKYLEFMCKLWVNRDKNGITRSATIIKVVRDFDSCLNYLSNKDIYSPEYGGLVILQTRIEDAMSRKTEKEFDPKKHGVKIYETDDILIVRPLTQVGSDKWGANTRWCTTGKSTRFNSYFKRGALIYLINKKNSKNASYNKIAFYTDWNNHSIFSSNIEVFNQLDSRITDRKLLENGWSKEEVITVFNIIRTYIFNLEFVFKAKENVLNVVTTLNKIDVNNLIESIKLIGESKVEDNDYILEIKNNIDFITNKLNSYL